MIEFGVLGPIEAVREAESLRLGGGKQRALLAALLLHANEVVSADRLIDQLWGEAPPETAGKALQVHVSQLRKLLEPERGAGDPGHVLITKSPGYILAIGPEQLDLTRFDRLAREGREALDASAPQRAAKLLREALALWRGPALADIAFEPFAQAEAARLEELRGAALEDRIGADLECGRHAEVVGELESLVAAEPLRERPRGQLMLALYRSGRQAEALDAYQRTRETLVEELGIEPGKELQRLHEAILRQDPSLDLAPARVAEPEPETISVPVETGAETWADGAAGFVGREREVAELTAALERALDGHGSVYLIGGEPGIGKSRLADELSRIASAGPAEAHVVWGRCWEAGGAPAYWPWVQALRSYIAEAETASLRAQLGQRGSEVAQILPELRERLPDLPVAASPESEGARFRLFDSTVSFVKRAAGDAPLVIVLEDLHAADTPSLLMLRFIADEIADSAVLILGTYRDVEVGPGHPLDAALDELGRQQSAHLLSLKGLDESQVSRLIGASAEVVPSLRAVAAIHRGTGGNPLFVYELVRLLVSENRLEDAAGDGGGRVGIPMGVQDVIGRRVGKVSDECGRLLGVAAVVGREFGLGLLAELTQRVERDLLDDLDEAMVQRIVSEVPGSPHRLRFSHALIRDVLYERLSASRRRRLHHRAGEALETLHAEDLEPHLAELAHHFFEAGPTGDPAKTLDYARLAGDRAIGQLAYEEAARLYELGIRVLRASVPGDDATRCELMLALGDAHLRAGDENYAKATFLNAAEIARRLDDSDALARAALGYGGLVVWMAARGDPHLIPLLEEALSKLPTSDSALRAKVMARLSSAVRDQTDRERRLPLSGEAVDIARRLGDRRTLAYALDARCISMVDPESMEGFDATAREVIQVAEEIEEVERAFIGNAYLLCSRLQMGDVDGAKRRLKAMARLAEELGAPTYHWGSLELEALFALFEGRFEAAGELIPRAYEVGRHAQTFNATAAYRQQRFLLHRECGGLEVCEDDLRQGVAETPAYHVYGAALANLCAALGRADAARTAFEELAENDFERVYDDEEFLASMTLLADVCATLGDRRRAETMYELLLPHAERSAVGMIEFALGSLGRPLGLLAGTLGRTDEAIDHFERAIAMNERMGARPWVAHARFDLGRILLETGEGAGQRAAALLSDSLEEFQALGMAPWQASAERVLDELRVRAD